MGGVGRVGCIYLCIYIYRYMYMCLRVYTGTIQLHTFMHVSTYAPLTKSCTTKSVFPCSIPVVYPPTPPPDLQRSRGG